MVKTLFCAALNISNDTYQQYFTPDYNKSVFQAYWDLAIVYLEKISYSLDVLAYCGTESRRLSIPAGTVSWVPLWKENLRVKIFPKRYVEQDGSERRTHAACGTYESEHPDFIGMHDIVRITGFELIARGFAIGEIFSRSEMLDNTTHRGTEGINFLSSWTLVNRRASFTPPVRLIWKPSYQLWSRTCHTGTDAAVKQNGTGLA
jgi:hypothetical protein